MSTMLVSVKKEICSGCATCISVCPFDAIKRDHILAEVDIDLEKCQLCGICYTACPASAIDITYYDSKTLIEKLRSLKEKRASDTLVLMCRGNSPSTCDVYKILKERGIETAEYIPLRLPCAGRVPVEVILHALNLGIRKVISIQCDDRYCRFKQGTKASTSRFALLNILLEQVGYDHDLITVVKHSRKVIYNTEECVGCGKCVFICPFGAIEAKDLGTPKIDLDLCVGCGACALVCPHGAIQLEGYELNNIITMISRLGETAKKLKERGKAPIILAFCCQWSEFLSLDQPENLLLKRNTFTIEIPCFKALDPFYVIEALRMALTLSLR